MLRKLHIINKVKIGCSTLSNVLAEMIIEIIV